MLLLHAYFDRGFRIWGERSFSAKEIPAAASPGAPHPWSASRDELAGALARAGLRTSAQAQEVQLQLPVAGTLPLPGSPLLGDLPSDEALPHRREARSVSVLHASVSDLLRLTSSIPGDAKMTALGCLIEHGVMASPDMCFVVECARFAASLLERGRFLPDVMRTEDADGEEIYESIWRPLLVGDDAERSASLARVMPAEVKKGSSASSAAVLSDMLGSITDGLIRSAWSGRRGSSDDRARPAVTREAIKETIADAVSAERKKRGRLVSALNPHALWARSLGWLGDAEGLSLSLESIYLDVRDWWSRFEWFAKAPFRLMVALSDEPDASGAWHISYSLRSLTTGETLSASEVWSAGAESSGGYMRRYLLLLLGRIGTVVPEVLASLSAAAPSGCELDTDGAAEFLSHGAAALEGMGVGVVRPTWWRASSIDRITLRGRLLSGSVDPTVFAYTVWSKRPGARERELSFAWEPAIDGELLSADAASALRGGSCPLVKIGDRWTFIRGDQLSTVMSHGESLPTAMTAGEAVRLAVRDAFVDGFTDAPDLEVVFETLRRGKPRVSLGAPAKMQGELRPYQIRGYSWMAFLTSLGFGTCLADDMGLGKTVQTLALVQHHRDMGDERPVLLICPTSVLENWRLEAAKFFPDMKIYIHHGRSRPREEKFIKAIAGATLVLTSYSLLARDLSTLERPSWLGIVLDEAQNIKNPDAHQSRAARSLSAEWRVTLTGTPIENHAGDLWSVMEFLMPGMLGPRKIFYSEYVKPIQEDRDRALAEALRRQVSPLIMRRMKTDRDIAPELPDKIESKVFCTLKREQAQLYSDVASRLSGEIVGVEGIKRKGMVLAAITKIKQICDHPCLYSDDGDMAPERSAKLERLLSLAEEMTASRGKTLIFTQYVRMGEILKTQLQERFGREVLFLHGGVQKDARDRMVARFQEPKGPRFFVLSLKAGGTGLNLTGANHVVMYDRWWNPAVEAQAIDRAYRIGQTRTVQVHIFCCHGTIEERIDAMLESKRELASDIIDGGAENIVTELSDRELQKLIALSPGAAEP